jgi:hypothetical protein
MLAVTLDKEQRGPTTDWLTQAINGGSIMLPMPCCGRQGLAVNMLAGSTNGQCRCCCCCYCRCCCCWCCCWCVCCLQGLAARALAGRLQAGLEAYNRHATEEMDSLLEGQRNLMARERQLQGLVRRRVDRGGGGLGGNWFKGVAGGFEGWEGSSWLRKASSVMLVGTGDTAAGAGEGGGAGGRACSKGMSRWSCMVGEVMLVRQGLHLDVDWHGVDSCRG